MPPSPFLSSAAILPADPAAALPVPSPMDDAAAEPFDIPLAELVQRGFDIEAFVDAIEPPPLFLSPQFLRDSLELRALLAGC